MKKILMTDLLQKVMDAIRDLGVSRKTIINYKGAAFAPIKAFYLDNHVEYYSKDTCDQLVSQVRLQYEQRLIGRSKYQCIRKVSAMMEEYHQKAEIKWSCLPNWGMRSLTNYFSGVLAGYVENKQHLGDLSPTSIKVYESAVRQFLFYLENLGHEDFALVTKSEINAYVPWFVERVKSGRGPSLFALRSFFYFLQEHGFIVENWANIVAIQSAPRRKIRPGFDRAEVEKILSAIDRATDVGKRDYAIILLAMRTGLRAIDISSIQFSNIDWRNHEICISQRKTGKPLSLPLFTDVGNAIADYILHGRPQSDSSYIFLRSARPLEKLCERSASSIADRYMDAAGIDRKKVERRGFHSFRRSVGTWLLEAEVPINTIREILGHSHPDSLKPYLSVDVAHLRECALSLAEFKSTREELR